MRLNLIHVGAAATYALVLLETKSKGEAKAKAAAFAGIRVRQFENWLAEPEFLEQVTVAEQQHAERLREELVELDVAVRKNRLARRNRRWLQLDPIIEAVTERLALAEEGKRWSEVQELSAVLERMHKREQDIEKQAAIEVGEWLEKREIDLTRLSESQLLALAAEAGLLESAGDGHGEAAVAGGDGAAGSAPADGDETGGED